MSDRVIALIDMDCFYCQVEVRLNSSLKDKPLAVVQYNTWKGGGIIAVNYEARDRGVTRHMRGDEAKSHCPEIELVHVPSVRGKADLTKYRDAGREVAAVLCENCKCVERASIDEAYLDLTEEVNQLLLKEEFVSESQLANTFIVGYSQQNNNDEGERSEGLNRWLYDLRNKKLDDLASKKLAFGACIVEEIRASVYRKTGFRCSAGIAHNKIMAKLVCGLHKPNRQTVLPCSGVAELFSNLPVQKVRNLGGKFGSTVIDTLNCKVMADLARFSEEELQSHFDAKRGTWLYNIARGIDSEPVTSKLMSKSIGCCKKFPGRSSLCTRQDVMHWLSELSTEIAERLDEDYSLYKRRAHSLTASVQQTINMKKVKVSKCSQISAYDAESIMQVALAAIKKTNNASPTSNTWQPPLEFLGLTVGKFVEGTSSSNRTIEFFPKTSTTGTGKSVPSTTAQTATQLDTESGGFCHVENLRSSDVSFKDNLGNGHKNSKNSSENKFSLFFKKVDKTKGSEITNEEINSKENFHTSLKENGEGSNLDSIVALENSNKVEQADNKVLSTKNETDSDCDMFDYTETSITNDLPEKSLKRGYTAEKNSNNKTTVIKCGDIILVSSESEECLVSTENGDVPIKDEEISWISPGEVFPDINNLDDTIVQLMPSPFRRKLESYRLEMSNPEPSNSLVVNNMHESLGVEKIKSSTHVVNVDENGSDSYQGTEISPDLFSDKDIDSCDSHLAVRSGNSDFTKNTIGIRDSETEISVECPHCGESVRLSEFPDHLDHHVALDLHKSLNSTEAIMVSKKRILNSTETEPLKNKRGRPSGREKSTEPSNSILNFFSKK
ncbi:DNA polymerase eta [Nilaparvata lugens]|uniref:DNA polymerase eta n=1 Tax=Nilaparvata lugens TaxID=108931 RepID=UPI00193E08D2|nr:DNA polymerase eta [Nilaparvata lugens]XP_039279391.1 DNA polymerase eta [Nilaparvata lugens]XP_039279392.1 DNA polymerase eta [Nilaparvata lugens]XP_039279393.1 DNA polymerase eta [Nilaparvata lugens]XP_039279394.1 DNA polymerase eta [Nilaparvata lugens]